MVSIGNEIINLYLKLSYSICVYRKGYFRDQRIHFGFT